MRVIRFGSVKVAALACALFLCVAAQAANGAAPLSSVPPTPSAPGAAAKGGFHGISQKPSKTKPYTPCPLDKVVVQCNIVIEPEPVKRGSRYYLPLGGPLLEGSGVEGGWSPADLQSAYGISASGGEGQTVALIDAYGYAAAESDLAEYRKQYGLSACTKANGCFKKVNQAGEEGNYPPPPPPELAGWQLETALDLDMVSAVCPKCNILLVQASGQLPPETAAAVETAAKLGATAISNSYGYMQNYQELCPKSKGCTEYAAAYNHPGIPITVSAGDSAYDEEAYAYTYGEAIAGQPSWPAAASTVIAVGGTELEKAENARGWSEHVWRLSGGGCSKYVAKPAWQSDPDCATRMGNDVAAVATNVSVYSSILTKGWGNVGGTSVSAPLIAGIEAQAPKAVREEGPEAFYRRKLNDVTSGVNGSCLQYLCEAQEGYDGPTGWGTPAGPLEELSTFGATTGATSHRTAEGAKLIGAVYPAAAETTYYFEYGSSASYGLSTSSASAGSGTLWKGVAQSVSGLPDGTYHYRLVAAHGATKTYGSDRTFQTQTWGTQSTLNEASGLNPLTSVSCSSSSACMAVGWHTVQNSSEPLAWSNRWNGSEWTKQKTANIGTAALTGVSCTASNACTAVGSQGSSTWLPLAQRWNGSEWTVQTVPSPAVETKEAQLESVSCTGASSCMTVGWYESGGASGTVPFAETWNGTEWKTKSVPIPGGAVQSTLTGISCASSTSCKAVGRYSNGEEFKALAETWNGTEWSVQSMPEPAGREGELNWTGVSCLSESSCIAVGWYWTTSGYRNAMAARWNGSSWTLQSLPAPRQEEGRILEDISCSSATLCVAVGLYRYQNGLERSLALRWNGVEWSEQGTEPILLFSDGIGNPSALLGVSCASLRCESVGWKENFGWSWSLAEGSIQTTPSAPSATTEAATNAKTAEPTLNASVNPNGYETHYSFEYDTKEYKSGEGAHGTSVSTGDLSPSYLSQHVSYTLKGLKQDTTYHFRVVAENSLGLTRGADQSFRTIPTPQWWSCTKQTGGRFSTSKCATEGAPNEWELLHLKEATKTTITAKGNPIAFATIQSGISTPFTCETEVASPSLENPSGGGNGVGNAEVKYKGCKAEGTWGEKGCKVMNTASPVSKLELAVVEGKTQVKLTPKEGESFATFTISGCAGSKALEALNGAWSLTGSAYGLYSNANSKIELSAETTAGLKLRGQNATAVGSIVLETTAGGYISAQAVAMLHWSACAKQGGGKYSSSKCTSEGAPNEWEVLALKEAEKTTIAAKGNPISFSTIVSGVSAPFTCETEVASPSLENPGGGGNGVGSGEVKYKGCKAEGLWGEKGCKVSNTATSVSRLELVLIEEKAEVKLTPKTGESFATFTVSGCAGSKALEALNGAWSLTGSAYGLYSNANSKIELTVATTANLKLRGQAATAVGSIVLETTAGGYVRAE